MSSAQRKLVDYDQMATRSVACPVCHAGPTHHCATPRRRAIRQTHLLRVKAHLAILNQRPKLPGGSGT